MFMDPESRDDNLDVNDTPEKETGGEIKGEDHPTVDKGCNEASEDTVEDTVNDSGMDEFERLKSELEKAEGEKKELINLMQRLQADFENFRRRTRAEKEELIKFAAEGIVTQLLPVLDNFERALSSAKDGGEMKGFSEGVEMIFRQLLQVLTNEGLNAVESVGCQFDPTCHEAVMQVEEEGYEKGTVIEELQKGYQLKGKLIRPSMVKVAK